MVPVKGKTFAFRAKPEIKERLERLAKALDRDYTWLIEKAIEAHLPALEQKYRKELAELDQAAAPSSEKSPALRALEIVKKHALGPRKTSPPE